MAAAESDRQTRLEAFKGDPKKWFTWRDRFEAYLDSKDWLDVLYTDRPIDEGKKQSTWDTINRKVYNALVLHVEGTVAAIVGQYKEGNPGRNGVAAWRALAEKFERKGAAQKAQLSTGLFTDTLRSGEEPDEFFVRMEERQQRLGGMGFKVSDEVLQWLMLARLPAEYTTLRSILDTVDDLDYSTFKERVRAFYLRGRAEPEEKESALLATGTFSGTCFNCGKRGHKKQDCTRKREAGNGQKSDGQRKPEAGQLKCFKCGGVGHKAEDCATKDECQFVYEEDWTI